MSLHDLMIQQLKSLNYRISEKGICCGIAMMGMQAILADELTVFNNRIITLSQIKNLKETLKKSIKRIKSQHKSKETFYLSLHFLMGLHYIARLMNTPIFLKKTIFPFHKIPQPSCRASCQRN